MSWIRTIAISLILFFGCSTYLYDTIEGLWEITRIEYDSTPIPIETLIGNTVGFYKGDSCDIPWMYNDILDRQVGKWNVFSNNDTNYLSISSSNKIFNDTFIVDIYHDSLMKVLLRSSKSTIWCTKFPPY